MTNENYNLENISNSKLVEMAKKSLSQLCATSGKSFTMSVPPQLEDTDIILNELIERFKFLDIINTENIKQRANRNPF